ncbi:MAG: hypothetical protein LBV74_15190 [Tannerella sp.]|jgi:hypothetical protein|nr:hypothetical protein [Tannerella sp.]
MKNVFLLLMVIIAGLAVTVGCSDDDKSKDDIILTQTSVIVAPNEIYPIAFNGGSGIYTTTVSDPEIAKAEISSLDPDPGYVLLIEAKKEGAAVIIVTDEKSGKSVNCSLYVKKNGSRFTIKEVRNAVDADVKDAIESDLRDNPPFPVGSCFVVTFDSENSERRIAIENPDGTEIMSGVLFFEELNGIPEIYKLLPPENQVYAGQKWNMDFGGHKYVYDMFLIRGELSTYSSVPVSPRHVHFYEDLTEYYKTEYPGAGVKGVVRVQLCQYQY